MLASCLTASRPFDGTIPFREAFSRKHGCSPDQFLRLAFWFCLHRRALPVAKIIQFTEPYFFSDDLALLEEAGQSDSWDELRGMIAAYREHCAVNRGWLHDRLRFRISARRLQRLFKRVMPPAVAREPVNA